MAPSVGAVCSVPPVLARLVGTDVLRLHGYQKPVRHLRRSRPREVHPPGVARGFRVAVVVGIAVRADLSSGHGGSHITCNVAQDFGLSPGP
jgi:hypothetical protein